MKSLIILAALIFLFSTSGFSQDSAKYKMLQKVNVHKNITDSLKGDHELHLQSSPHIYRDTRMGSSSPLYNSYKKNDYGAGAITTNPNKSAGPSFIYASPIKNTDSLNHDQPTVIHH